MHDHTASIDASEGLGCDAECMNANDKLRTSKLMRTQCDNLLKRRPAPLHTSSGFRDATPPHTRCMGDSAVTPPISNHES